MITFRFLCDKKISSKIIALFSAGPLSHVDVKTEKGWLGARINGGVKIRPWNYIKPICEVQYDIETTKEQEEEFWKFVNAQIGKPYDWTAIVAFVTGRNWRKPDTWYCSEILARALEVSRIIHPLYITENKVTPVGLVLITSAIGTKRK